MSTVDNSANKENDTQIANNNTESTTKTIETTIMNGDKKEEEPSTTNSNTNTKSDNNNSNPEKLLSEARKLIDLKKYEEASMLCSTALNIIQTQNKEKVTSIQSAQYYMTYGEALLRLIQSSNDIFAAPVRDSQKQHMEQETEEVEAPTLITDVTDNESPKENSKQENDEENEDDDIAPPAAAPPSNGDVDTSEDREIAWESFEYARIILEDYLNGNVDGDNGTYIKMLGLTHSFLGELSIEDENNEQALKEFEKALELYVKCDDIIDGRQIAADRFMACLASQFMGNNDSALQHCNLALKQLSFRVIEILKEFKCDIDEEYKENEYNHLIEITNTFINNISDEQKGNKMGKELMDLNASMNDLICKLDEVKENIKFEKENKGKINENNNSNDIMTSDDPLAALIKGLTSKFGIDQAQLDELDKIDINNGNEKNTNNNKKDEGVTCIGFGNNNVDNDDEDDVNELGSFGVDKSCKKNRKRTMDQAGIDMDSEMEQKKVKLNSGDAVVAKGNEKVEK